MKTLTTAWIVTLAVAAGGAAWLWFTDVPELKAEPEKPVVIKEQGKAPEMTTGPMTFDLQDPKTFDEDCPKSC